MRCMKFIIAVLYMLLASSSLVFMKRNFPQKFDGFHSIIPMIVPISGYVLSFLLWLIILSKFKLVQVYPVAVGMTLILTAIGSYFFLDEKLTAPNIVGIGVIIIGVILVTYK